MADRNVSVVLREAAESIARAKKVYEVGFEKLLSRTSAKMMQFASGHAGLAASHEELMKKVQELQGNFQQKSEEVDGLLGQIEKLKTSAFATDSRMSAEIEDLGGKLAKMKEELSAKASEAEELSGQLTATQGKGSEMAKEYMQMVNDLADSYDGLSGKYNELADRFEKLAHTSQGSTKVDLAHTEFDFMDHLKNALSKNTRKRIWGDW